MPTDDFFSPEALRLLDNNPRPAFHLNDLVLFDQVHVAAAPCQTQMRRKNIENIPGCSTLNIGNGIDSKRKPGKFDEGDRRETANVRRKGVCMRCGILSIRCSETWPCRSCTVGVTTPHGREPKYRWMQGVPFSLKKVDIFKIDSPCSQYHYKAILRDCDRSFEPVSRWGLSAISSSCTNWITTSTLPANLDNFAWIFASLNSERLLSSWVSPDLSMALRVLIEISSVLHNWGCDANYAGYSATDLWSIRSFAGSQVLQGLDAALSINMLAKASQGGLKALFLVLFGATTAVGCWKPIVQSEKKHQGLSGSSSAAFSEDAQNQLLRVLIHQMLHIAERAYLLDGHAIRDRLFDKLTYSQWHGKAVLEKKIRYPPDSIFLATYCDRRSSADQGHAHHQGDSLFRGVGNNTVSVESLRIGPPSENPPSCRQPSYQGIIGDEQSTRAAFVISGSDAVRIL